MAALDTFLCSTGLDYAHLAVLERYIGQAPLAFNILHTHVIDLRQSLFELEVVIPVRNIYATYTAVQTAWSRQFLVVRHFYPLSTAFLYIYS
jgi:hypothetical protein